MMSSSAGKRGDTRRETDVLESYEMKKAELHGLLNIKPARSNKVDFLLMYRRKIKRKFSKAHGLATKLLLFYRASHYEHKKLEKDLHDLTARFEGRRTELDDLLRMRGVSVGESDSKESDCDASSVSLSLCSTEDRVQSPLGEVQAAGDRSNLPRPYRAQYSASQFMPSCYYGVPDREFSFHDHHFVSGEGNINAMVSRVPM